MLRRCLFPLMRARSLLSRSLPVRTDFESLKGDFNSEDTKKLTENEFLVPIRRSFSGAFVPRIL